jgi:hypothetical protein
MSSKATEVVLSAVVLVAQLLSITQLLLSDGATQAQTTSLLETPGVQAGESKDTSDLLPQAVQELAV